MTPAEIEGIVRNAKLILPKKYPSFVDCVWNDRDRAIIFSFSSVVDADQFVMWKQMLNTPFALKTNVRHANLITVSEYHPQG